MDFDPGMDDYDSDYIDFDLCMDDDELDCPDYHVAAYGSTHFSASVRDRMTPSHNGSSSMNIFQGLALWARQTEEAMALNSPKHPSPLIPPSSEPAHCHRKQRRRRKTEVETESGTHLYYFLLCELHESPKTGPDALL